MEDAGVLITVGGIFLGIYFIIKASAQLLSTRREQQAQEAEGLKDAAETSDAEGSAFKDNNRESQ